MKYIAIPKNKAWTNRIIKSCQKAGFIWDGTDCSGKFDTRPKSPWGCIVKKYISPMPPRKGFGACVGIMIGTHDEFGRPLKKF